MGTALTAASAAGVAGVWQGAAPAGCGLFSGYRSAGRGGCHAGRHSGRPAAAAEPFALLRRDGGGQIQGITFTDPETGGHRPEAGAICQPPEIQPRIPGAVLVSETMAGSPSAVCWQIGAGWLRNYTEIPRAQIDAELSEPLELAPKADGRVEVLISAHPCHREL